MDSAEEIWKDIPGYEGLYQVSNLGRINSLFTNTVRKTVNRNGYRMIGLNGHDKRKFYQVHRLVALAFLPNLANKKEINHKNGNKTDNNISNLEWATRSENCKHKYAVLNQEQAYAYKPVVKLSENGLVLEEFKSIAYAAELSGIDYRRISECANGKRAIVGGFVWKFKEAA